MGTRSTCPFIDDGLALYGANLLVDTAQVRRSALLDVRVPKVERPF